ncbi:MAG TPA: hypothetical protein VG271_03930 [Beijerinckiaceae bacterium]|nr:hypothetical protein [Beijerinckiaceae bacterium]
MPSIGNHVPMSNWRTVRETPFGRTALAISLVYLLLLRSLFWPFPSGAAPAGPDILGAFVICSHAGGSSAPTDQGTPASDHHDCCDDCCLTPLAGFVPPILVALLILLVFLVGGVSLLLPHRCKTTGPPGRIAARPQAPRAPPRLGFV